MLTAYNWHEADDDSGVVDECFAAIRGVGAGRAKDGEGGGEGGGEERELPSPPTHWDVEENALFCASAASAVKSPHEGEWLRENHYWWCYGVGTGPGQRLDAKIISAQ